MQRTLSVVVWMVSGCAGISDAPSPSGVDGGVVDGAALGTDGSTPPADAPLPTGPTAAQLMARIASCASVVGGPYRAGNSSPATISVCGVPDAVFWKADLDVDCDGKVSAQCNLMTDPYFMDQTAGWDSNGDPLDAATLPFVVIPGRSSRFDYRAAGLTMGSVVVVIYQDRVVYGVLGDVGPTAIIGEASYRMAELLGIDPDPSTGGVETGVAYIAFTGPEARVEVMEDHDEATAAGIELATMLLSTP